MEQYSLVLNEASNQQESVHLSFVGGVPRIPEKLAIPTCRFCEKEQTFYFQITFPSENIWEDRTMALFACTSCSPRDYSIPEMLSVGLYGADIPKGFLDVYQRNFRIFVFDASEGVMRKDYLPKIRFAPLMYRKRVHRKWKRFGYIGGKPRWYLQDESPSTYDMKVKMQYLFQIVEGWEFDILPDAPGQMKYPWFSADSSDYIESQERYYKLFNRNEIYFFGTEQSHQPLVYVLTQC